MLLPFGILGTRSLPVSAAQDVGQQVWWLALALHDLSHGSWSFFTSAIDHPSGVNLLDNGSMPLLGVLMAPVTAIFGPIASFLLLLRIGHFVSALALYAVARRLGFGVLAAAVAGLVYGFGPAMGPPTAQHAFLVFAPLPPLMLYIIFRKLTAPGRAFRAGLVLGVLAAAQYLISPEALMMTLLVAVCSVVLAVLWTLLRRRVLPIDLGASNRLLAGAVSSSVPLLAYPIGYQLLGRAHVDGPIQPTGQLGVDLLAFLFPTRAPAEHYGEQLVAALWHGWAVAPGLWPQVDLGYLGPLALMAVAVAIVGRSEPRVRVAALVGGVSAVLALGPRLSVAGHELGVPLPYDVLYHVPLLQDGEPTRLTLLVALAVALLTAAGVDRLLARIRSGPRATEARVAVGIVAVSLVLAAPATGLTVHSASVSRRVVNGMRRDLPAGAVVLAVPYPSFNHEAAMRLQAGAGFSFDLLGGYAIRPAGPGRVGTKVPLLNAPGPLARLLTGHSVGPEATMAAAADLPAWLRSDGVNAVLILPSGSTSRTLARITGDDFGHAIHVGRWLLWRRLRAPKRRPG